MTEEKTVCIKGETKRLDTKEDVADIIRQIEECDGLTCLQLSGNSFGVDATKAIGEILANRPHLTRALWSDMFVSRLKSEIPPALVALGDGIMTAQAHLTELDLSDNAFGPTGVEPIIPLLTSPSFYSIKVLKFNNNGLGIKGGTYLSKALLQCHEEAQKVGLKLALEVFVAGRNRLEDSGAIALSEVFEIMGSLLHISMPQNGITSDGICALAKAFSSNPNLEIIDLNDNTFTEVGSKSMADVLPSLQKLKVINFGDCLVRSEGAREIAAAVKDGHQQLEEVNLSFCELDQEAGLVVAESLSNKKSLKKIELNGNSFGEEGIERLRDLLEAKGCTEALGSLSDDEGLEEDEEEEEEEEEGRREGSENEDERKERDTNKENENKTQDHTEKIIGDTQRVTIAEYLRDPTGKKLEALGDSREQLILNTLARNSPSDEDADFEKNLAWASDTAAMFTKLTKDYDKYADVENHSITKDIIEKTVDAILEPLCKADLVAHLLNEILIHIGLLKSEDKKFVPIKEIDGPVLALKHVVKQDYFPRMSADVLIAFFTKPSSVLAPLQQRGIVYQLLQVLHTL